MLHPVTVQLQDQQEAVISTGRVEIRDVRAYSPKLVAILDIEDAITLARTILAIEETPVGYAFGSVLDANREAYEDQPGYAESLPF